MNYTSIATVNFIQFIFSNKKQLFFGSKKSIPCCEKASGRTGWGHPLPLDVHPAGSLQNRRWSTADGPGWDAWPLHIAKPRDFVVTKCRFQSGKLTKGKGWKRNFRQHLQSISSFERLVQTAFNQLVTQGVSKNIWWPFQKTEDERLEE